MLDLKGCECTLSRADTHTFCNFKLGTLKALFYLALSHPSIIFFFQIGIKSLLHQIGTYTVLIGLMTQFTSVYAVSRVYLKHQTTSILSAHTILAKSDRKAYSCLMKQEEIRANIQKAAEAWRTGDADGFAKLFASNGLFIVPGNRWL